MCLFGAGRITRLNLTGRLEPGNNDAVRSLSNGHWVSVPLIVLGLALVGLVRGLGFCSDAKHCKRHNRPEALRTLTKEAVMPVSVQSRVLSKC